VGFGEGGVDQIVEFFRAQLEVKGFGHDLFDTGQYFFPA
jgi:hypothetical protein